MTYTDLEFERYQLSLSLNYYYNLLLTAKKALFLFHKYLTLLSILVVLVAANRVPSWISSITRKSFFHSSGPHSAKLNCTFVLKRSARALQQLMRTLHSLFVRLSVTSINISLRYCSIYDHIKKNISLGLLHTQ